MFILRYNKKQGFVINFKSYASFFVCCVNQKGFNETRKHTNQNRHKLDPVSEKLNRKLCISKADLYRTFGDNEKFRCDVPCRKLINTQWVLRMILWWHCHPIQAIVSFCLIIL